MLGKWFRDFNPLRREGGDEECSRHQTDGVNFNPLRREGGDAFTTETLNPPNDFNPLRREGGDELDELEKEINRIFQSTPPRGRRLTTVMYLFLRIGDFNPLRREGGDPQSQSVMETWAEFQSTPPRGRRRKQCPEGMSPAIFQSTPPRGRRLYEVTRTKVRTIISIHSAARAETVKQIDFPPRKQISIHSAARAETLFDRPVCMRERYFNPLRREGGDLGSPARLRKVPVFQSTPPRGRRLILYKKLCLPSYFNPLRREGGDM